MSKKCPFLEPQKQIGSLNLPDTSGYFLKNQNSQKEKGSVIKAIISAPRNDPFLLLNNTGAGFSPTKKVVICSANIKNMYESPQMDAAFKSINEVYKYGFAPENAPACSYNSFREVQAIP